MGSFSQDRLKEKVYKTISLLLVSKKLYSIPENAFVTIRRVELSTDNKAATVYYTYLGDEALGEKVKSALLRSTGVIQHHLSTSMKTKNTPKLIFKEDIELEKARHVDELLNEIKAHNSL